MNLYQYAAGNPINYVDLTGFVPGSPTATEGRLIHAMIERDFITWGGNRGHNVRVEVTVAGASKAVSILASIDTGNGRIVIRSPIPDNDDPTNGRADLVDLTLSQAYKIKHIPTAIRGIALADAEWYRWHLMTDPNWSIYGPWTLGTEYLKYYPYGATGKQIGTWPGDPNYRVYAVSNGPGAIGYYAKRKLSSDPILVYVLSLATLKAIEKFLATCQGGLPQLQPAPAIGPIIILPYGVLCEAGFYDFCEPIKA